jgi:hypothetical protein
VPGKLVFSLRGFAVTELSFRLGAQDGSFVIVRPTRWEVPESTGHSWDADWLHANVEVRAGAFHGEVEALLRSDDFVRFVDGLRVLYEKLSGVATFDTLEHWLRIDVRGDGKGHLHADCLAMDEPGTGNRLAFEISFDQTDLPPLIRDLEAICRAFPIRGERASKK